MDNNIIVISPETFFDKSVNDFDKFEHYTDTHHHQEKQLLIHNGNEENIRMAVKAMVSIHNNNENHKTTTHLETTTWENSFEPPTPSVENPPEFIFATYIFDLNILKIHEAVRARFASHLHRVPEMMKHVNEMRCEASTQGNITLVERKSICIKADEIEKEAERIRSHSKWFDYINAARPIIERYIPIATNEAKGSVIIGGEENVITRLEKDERLRIITEYISVASKFIKIHAFNATSEVVSCPVCGIPVEDTLVSGEDYSGTVVCNCGRESISIAKAPTFRDSVRIDTGIKNSYDDLGNFIKRLDAFEGKQRSQPPPLLYTQLEEYFEKNPLPCGLSIAQIKEAPLTDKGKKEGTSIQFLEEALLRTSNSAFYRDTELISHKLWGWKLADLTSNGLRRRLISDYIDTQKVYEEVKERESSLNVNLRLFFHLSAIDYPCSLEDFKIVSSQDSLNYHKKMIKLMSNRTGLKFTPFT